MTHLGIDPSASLKDLHQRILTADQSLASTVTKPVVIPRQLPAAPGPFVGRHDELTRLDTAVSATSGAGGIGKTWLALHWAHQHLERFPDGQLFVDLHGFSPDSPPTDPAVVLRGFLEALGIDADRVPADPHVRTALFRSLVAGKRLLLVLDNAADTGQVTPLLPGGATCTVLVTSRNRLPGLITGHAAHPVSLDVLSDVDARVLLTDRLGPARLADESAVVDELIRLCGGFPLALSIVAGRAQTHPRIPLVNFVSELRDLGLHALGGDDPTASLPTVLSWSTRSLTSNQHAAFGLLGLAPGPDITLSAAATLINASPAQTGRVLRELEVQSLLTRDDRGRYRMHDLIRDHAVITAHQHLTEETREVALRRVVDFYLQTAHQGHHQLYPDREPIPISEPVAGCRPLPLDDQPSALAWFEAERANLLAAQQCATTHGFDEAVWSIADATNVFLTWRGHHDDRAAMWRTARAASARNSNTVGEALACLQLGRTHTRQHRYTEAIDYLQQALRLAEAADHAYAQAMVHDAFANLWDRREDHRRSLSHAVQALPFFRSLRSAALEGRALLSIGASHAELGQYDQARHYCEQALAHFRTGRSRDGQANAFDTLGYIAARTGDHDQAIRHYREALALFHSVGDVGNEPKTWHHLGDIHAQLGELEQARTSWLQAHALYQQQGLDDYAARVQRQLDTLGSA